MPIEMFIRGFLATFFIMVAVLYSAKLTAVRRRDGQVPVYRGAPGSSARVTRLLFEVSRIAIVAAVLVHAAAPSLDRYFVPFDWLAVDAVQMLGAGLMLAGAWGAIYAHTYMGALWRSGVPDEAALDRAPDALLQTGPFARTRNPIFLCVAVAQLGFFMAWPSLFTALCLLFGIGALLRQVRVEEETLRARFGPSYAHYQVRTPRWL